MQNDPVESGSRQLYDTGTNQPRGSENRKSPAPEGKTLPSFGTELRDSAESKPLRCDDRHLASILRLTFETLGPLISGLAAFVPKLTGCETGGEAVRSSSSIFQSKDDPEIDFRFQYKMILKI